MTRALIVDDEAPARSELRFMLEGMKGMEVVGAASHTISQGKVVYADGELDVERGAGQYIEKPPFAAKMSGKGSPLMRATWMSPVETSSVETQEGFASSSVPVL